MPRVAGSELDAAPARRVNERDEHGHRAPRRVGEALFAVGHRQDVPLQVGRGQPRVAAREPARLGDVGRQRSLVGHPPAGEVPCRRGFSHSPRDFRRRTTSRCTTGWSDRFAPHRGCRPSPGCPALARWSAGPMPDSISSCGLPIAPPATMTSASAGAVSPPRGGGRRTPTARPPSMHQVPVASTSVMISQVGPVCGRVQVRVGDRPAPATAAGSPGSSRRPPASPR